MTTEVSVLKTLLSSGQKKCHQDKNIVLRTKKVGTSSVYGLRPSMFIEVFVLFLFQCLVLVCSVSLIHPVHLEPPGSDFTIV